VERWREAAPGRPCDVMIDTGMNRLGLSAADVADGLLDGLAIDTLMSHLACADEDVAMNARQRRASSRSPRGFRRSGSAFRTAPGCASARIMRSI
jgi:alanine racemase